MTDSSSRGQDGGDGRTRSEAREASRIIINVGEVVPETVPVPSQVANTAIRRSGFDVFLQPDAIAEIADLRAAALVQVHRTLTGIRGDLGGFLSEVPQTLPSTVRGTVLNADGQPAATVAVEVPAPTFEQDPGFPVPWPRPRVITDGRGVFSVRLPNVPIPDGGLRLEVRGRNTTTSVQVERRDLLSPDLGVVVLDTTLTPLPRSIVARLGDIVPTDEEDAEEHPQDFASPEPSVMLGEGDCARAFRNGSGVIDRHRYSVLIRLVDPLVSPKHLVLRRQIGERGYVPIELESSLTHSYRSLDRHSILEWFRTEGEFRFTDRVPVDSPIDVAAFHEDVAEAPRDVPKAGTLGLGYVLHLTQTWVPAGLSLGNLLYSLPLAPGEEQRVAVFEQRETLSVRDTERLDVAEMQRFAERADTSSSAVFQSAFDEAIRGGSRINSSSKSGSIGGALGAGGLFGPVLAGIGIAGGYGSSSSSGSTSSWQNTSRDFVSSASEEFHSYLTREAAARRSAARTGVRLASAGEIEALTTKRIANNNHCHALTVQYWEVLRHYGIASRIDDVQLVCYVPLELIPWLPAGHFRTLGTDGAQSRSVLLARYAMLLRYADVLDRYLPRSEHRYGLKLLRQFASDPRAGVEPAAASGAATVTVRLQGTFLPFEDVYASLVTESGVRVGPFRMAGPSPTIADGVHESRPLVVGAVQELRRSESGVSRQVIFALPRSVARSDIALLELTRVVRPFTYRLKPAVPDSIFEALGSLSLGELVRLRANETVTLSPADLDREVGGPLVWDVVAEVTGAGETAAYVNAASGRAAAMLMADRLPFPTVDLPPLLSFEDLLRIEDTLQHVMGDAVHYSKAVWWSMDPDERAILLERFTVGVPEGGAEDPSQEVPLLNCVANKVLGFFGNAMVMPFHVPPQLAEEMGFTSREVQDALIRFHRQAFRAPTASITLPTRGMLGEAVLGSCNSCEKIDLTRFWNWQDSPIREAEAPRQEAFGQTVGLQGTAAATAPATLTPPAGSLINIATTDRPDGASLAEKLIAALPAGTQLNATGLDQLLKAVQGDQSNANAARQQAIDQASTLAQKAMTELPNVLKQTAEAKKADEKAAEDEKKKAAEAEKAKTEAAAKERTTALGTLKDQAADLISLAGAQPSDDAANGWATSLVSKLLGADTDLTPVEEAGLFGKYRIGTNDDAATKRGKTAMLRALGLPVPE